MSEFKEITVHDHELADLKHFGLNSNNDEISFILHLKEKGAPTEGVVDAKLSSKFEWLFDYSVEDMITTIKWREKS